MLENKKIRYKTDKIGFLLITIKIPDITASVAIISRKVRLNPLKRSRLIKKKCIVFNFYLLPRFTRKKGIVGKKRDTKYFWYFWKSEMFIFYICFAVKYLNFTFSLKIKFKFF